MQSLRKLRWSHAVFGAVLAIACTDTYLHDPRRVDSLPADRAVAIEGKFCTPATNEAHEFATRKEATAALDRGTDRVVAVKVAEFL